LGTVAEAGEGGERRVLQVYRSPELLGQDLAGQAPE
jgi:hypothetical protein